MLLLMSIKRTILSASSDLRRIAISTPKQESVDCQKHEYAHLENYRTHNHVSVKFLGWTGHCTSVWMEQLSWSPWYKPINWTTPRGNDNVAVSSTHSISLKNLNHNNSPKLHWKSVTLQRNLCLPCAGKLFYRWNGGSRRLKEKAETCGEGSVEVVAGPRNVEGSIEDVGIGIVPSPPQPLHSHDVERQIKKDGQQSH